MKNRTLKYIALCLSGGVLFQISGCVASVPALVAELVLSGVLRSIIEGVLGAGAPV